MSKKYSALSVVFKVSSIILAGLVVARCTSNQHHPENLGDIDQGLLNVAYRVLPAPEELKKETGVTRAVFDKLGRLGGLEYQSEVLGYLEPSIGRDAAFAYLSNETSLKAQKEKVLDVVAMIQKQIRAGKTGQPEESMRGFLFHLAQVAQNGVDIRDTDVRRFPAPQEGLPALVEAVHHDVETSYIQYMARQVLWMTTRYKSERGEDFLASFSGVEKTRITDLSALAVSYSFPVTEMAKDPLNRKIVAAFFANGIIDTSVVQSLNLDMDQAILQYAIYAAPEAVIERIEHVSSTVDGGSAGAQNLRCAMVFDQLAKGGDVSSEMQSVAVRTVPSDMEQDRLRVRELLAAAAPLLHREEGAGAMSEATAQFLVDKFSVSMEMNGKRRLRWTAPFDVSSCGVAATPVVVKPSLKVEPPIDPELN